jgi:hypothetical protein
VASEVHRSDDGKKVTTIDTADRVEKTPVIERLEAELIEARTAALTKRQWIARKAVKEI